MPGVGLRVFVGLLGVGLLVAGGAVVIAQRGRPKCKVVHGIPASAEGAKRLPRVPPRPVGHGASKFGYKMVKVRGRLVWKKRTEDDVRAAWQAPRPEAR
jgi:hypothetical protein